MSRNDGFNALMSWLPYCKYASSDIEIYRKAQYLGEKYQFQLFDSIIVASAIESGCQMLFSEDMQHNLLVEKSLKIINPFVPEV
jgi:predicted nucleic acid-binding protein